MGDLIPVFIGIIALVLIISAIAPVLSRLFTRCPKCKASDVETRDESNEFTGRTYREWKCVGCRHQWSRRLWLQTNNGVDRDRIEWSRPNAPPNARSSDVNASTSSSSEETFGGGDSGGGGAGSSW